MAKLWAVCGRLDVEFQYDDIEADTQDEAIETALAFARLEHPGLDIEYVEEVTEQ